MSANPTEAKEIVLHFIAKTGGKNTHRSDIARWTNSAKTLLETYDKRTIINVINHCVDFKKLYIYSFGFISRVMDDMIMELDAIEEKEKAAQYIEEIASSPITVREEVKVDEQAAERNRRKASGFGIQSRLRAQYSFDLYEGTKQTD